MSHPDGVHGTLSLLRQWVAGYASDKDLAARTFDWSCRVRWNVDSKPFLLTVADGRVSADPWPEAGASQAAAERPTDPPDLEVSCERGVLEDLATGREHFFRAVWGSGRIALNGPWADAYRLGYLLSRDGRSRRVVFIAHCWLNINTRFPGGGSHPGANPSVVKTLMDAGVGWVQMPCPEYKVFGLEKERFGSLRPAAARASFEAVAEGVVDEITDYLRLGFDVPAIVGMDPSPSCGVRTTKGKPALLGESRDATEVPGQGAFFDALERIAKKKRVILPPVVAIRRVLSPEEGDPDGLADLARLLRR